jgi:hypothetical protein
MVEITARKTFRQLNVEGGGARCNNVGGVRPVPSARSLSSSARFNVQLLALRDDATPQFMKEPPQ